jgi:hypothetical protein
VDFYEGDAIVASTIPKWWTFKPLRRVQLFKRFEDLDKILCGGDDIEGGVDHSKTVNV